ncbi:MAG: response regulator transcription factor [Chloroflexota bacterium]
MKPISVVTLDDHHLVRVGIRSVLINAPDVEVVGEGSTGEHLELLLEQHNPDVVLLDLGMPEKTGQATQTPGAAFRALPAISRLRERYPNTRVIIVSQQISQALVEGALERGVRGYLLKDDALSVHLAEAIRTVHLGGLYLSEGVSRQWRTPQVSPNTPVLTQRQQEVIQAVASNPEFSYAEHARRLDISEHTLTNHLRQVFERLGTNNVTAAVVKALQMGIVSFSTVEPTTGSAR